MKKLWTYPGRAISVSVPTNLVFAEGRGPNGFGIISRAAVRGCDRCRIRLVSHRGSEAPQ